MTLHKAVKEFTSEPDGINFSLALLQPGIGFRQVILQLKNMSL